MTPQLRLTGAPRTALVTGITGFLGSQLARALLRDGHRVVGLVRQRSDGAAPRERATHALEAVAPLSFDEQARLVIVEADLTNPVPELFRKLSGITATIQEIWHCAVVFKFNERDRDEIIANNIDGTRNLLCLALAAGQSHAPVFFQVSTAFVCGERTGQVLEVCHRGQRFHNLYEWSKSEAECLVLDSHNNHGLETVIFRPSIIVGHSQTGLANSDTGYYGVVRALYRLRNSIDASLGKHSGIRDLGVRLEGDPLTELNVVPIDFVIDAMVKIARAPRSGPGIVHVVNENPPTLGFAVQCLLNDLGVSGLSLVHAGDFDGTPMTGFDKLLRRRVDFQAPYLRTQLNFSAAAFRKLVPQVILPPPQFDEALFRKLNRSFIESLDAEFAASNAPSRLPLQ